MLSLSDASTAHAFCARFTQVRPSEAQLGRGSLAVCVQTARRQHVRINGDTPPGGSTDDVGQARCLNEL